MTIATTSVRRTMYRVLFLLLTLPTACREVGKPTSDCAAPCEARAVERGARFEVERPFVVPSATAPVEQLIACESGGWSEYLAGIPELGDERIVSVPAYGPDGRVTSAMFAPWPTDEWLVGFRGNRRAVLYLPGKRSLDGWGNPFFDGKAWERFEIGVARDDAAQSRFDKGGNVLASPPLHGFPFGRLIVGRSLQQDVKDFFRQQHVQAGPGEKLIEIDTDWLKVGHVDEIFGFVRAQGRLGFRVVLPDFEAGMRLLDAMPAERAMFYAQGSAETAGSATGGGARFLECAEPGLPPGEWKYLRITSGTGAGQVALIRTVEGRRVTLDRVWDLRGTEVSQAIRAARHDRCETMPIWLSVPDATSRFIAVEGSQMWLDGTGQEFPALVSAGELSRDPSLQSTAQICAARLRADGTGVSAAMRDLGVREEDVVRLPVVFCSDGQGASAAALLPNPVNLVPLDNNVVLLRPFGPRANPADDESDVFTQAWTAQLKEDALRAVFVDGWNSLHRSDGGAHCGTNVIRKQQGPVPDGRATE